jgi:hypothetical protein
MQRYLFPSLAKVLLTFVLLGPFLWPIGVLLVGSLQLHLAPSVPNPPAALLGVPLISLLGAVMWWWASFKSNMWLGTWAPTVLAAITYWSVMSDISYRTPWVCKSKIRWLATNALVCALVSAATFSAVVSLGMLLGAEVEALPAKLQLAMAPQSWATLACWATVVGFVGAVLGAVIGALCAQAPNPSIERTRPGKPGRASHVKR